MKERAAISGKGDVHGSILGWEDRRLRTCWLWWNRTPKMKRASRNMASMSQRWGLLHPAQHRRLRPAATAVGVPPGRPGECPVPVPTPVMGSGLAGVDKLLSGTGIVASWTLHST